MRAPEASNTGAQQQQAAAATSSSDPEAGDGVITSVREHTGIMAPSQQVQLRSRAGVCFLRGSTPPTLTPLFSLPPAASELAKLLGNRTRALMAFEDPEFEAGAFMAAYLGQLGEKAIDNARRDLGALLATCTEEVGALRAGRAAEHGMR
jgi:hypothetical protein